MDVFEGLNPEQQKAVAHDEGPLLVVAGAGTGKTQVITRRIAHLVQEGRAKPTEVLALTFTEKATREMADRLHDLIGWESFQVPVMTFNAFGAELLGQYATHIGRSVRGGLINSTQKALLLRQHFDDVELAYYGVQADLYGFLEGVVAYIERLQNGGVDSARYREYVRTLQPIQGELTDADIMEQRDLAALYELYDNIKTQTGTYDYNDQLAIPLHILRERPHLAERLGRQYRYVLVDEYQDTSPVQDQLLRLMVPVGGNIFAVGDDDQAIYRFRGADISNILGFAEHFGVDEPLALIENYRSGQAILDAAYRLIRHNDPLRLEVKLGLNKRLHAQHDGSRVEFRSYASAADEELAVVEEMAHRVSAGEPLNQFAVLARSHSALKGYAKALRMRNIPFSLTTSVNIFEQRELISLWYLLEWLGHRVREEAIAHVVMGPFIGWTASDYRPVVARAQSDLSSLETALQQIASEGDERAMALIDQLGVWRGWAADLPVSQLAYRLVFETGLAERLLAAAEQSPRMVNVFEDLHLLLEQMQDFETVSLDGSLAGYLAAFPKPPTLEARETVGDSGGIQLLTVHAAKGLEFDTVFVVGCAARAWMERPTARLEIPRQFTEGAELPAVHEQRRLMYVAATRAKRELRLSAAAQTSGGLIQPVSPFVEELLGEAPELAARSNQRESAQVSMIKLQRLYPLKQDDGSNKLPFESDEGWLNLAVGALDLYDRCPYEFYLQHVLAIAHPFGPQLAFGVAIHGAVQTYYEARLRGEEAKWDDLKLRLDELWSARGYETRGLAAMAYQKAQSALSVFYEREKTTDRKVVGSELKVLFEVPEAKLRLRGRIDACFETPEGIEIRDFKTGNKRDAEKLAADAKASFQLRTYALAYEAMTGQVPAAVTLDYLVTGVEGSASLSSRILANHRQKLVKLAEQIRLRNFAPAPLSEYHQCAAFTYYGSEYDEEAVV